MIRRASTSWLALRIALLGVAVALPVSADAPVGPTDHQYDYFKADNKTISDRYTKLVWERPPTSATVPYPAKMTFANAKSYCGGLTLAGAAGTMRLPSMKELLTLIDEEPHLEYDGTTNVLHYIDPLAFSNTPADEFWTSSLSKVDGSRAYTVHFGDAQTRDASTGGDAKYVRCVRALP